VNQRATPRTPAVSPSAFVRLLGVPDIAPASSPFDPGYDPVTLESHLAQSHHLISILKISMACWLIADEGATRSKFAAARAHGVRTVTGDVVVKTMSLTDEGITYNTLTGDKVTMDLMDDPNATTKPSSGQVAASPATTRSSAVVSSSLEQLSDMRRCPAPLLPNALPGITATFSSSSQRRAMATSSPSTRGNRKNPASGFVHVSPSMDSSAAHATSILPRNSA